MIMLWHKKFALLSRWSVAAGIVLAILLLVFWVYLRLGISWDNILLGLLVGYGLLLGIRYPVFALGFVLLLLPLKALYLESDLIYLPKVAMVIPILGLLAEISIRRRRLQLTGLEWPIGITVILIMLHYPNSFRPSEELTTVWSLLCLFGLVVVMVNLLTDERSLRFAVVLFMLSAVIPSSIAYFQWFTGQPILGSGPMFFRDIPRATGSFTSITGLGCFLSAYFPFYVSLLLQWPIAFFRKKHLDWIVVFFCSGPLIIAFNRGGIFAVLLGLLFLVYRLRSHRRFKVSLLILVGVGALLVFILFHPAWQFRLFGTGVGNTPEGYEQRLRQTKMIGYILTNYPLGGIGLGNYRFLATGWPLRLAEQPHNLLLTFAAAGGVFGILTLASFIFILARKVRRSKIIDVQPVFLSGVVVESTLVALIGYTVQFLTHGALVSDTPWILIGFLIAGSNIVQRVQKERNQVISQEILQRARALKCPL